MALIKCPECGEQISNQAKVCIHCGFPLENIKSNKRYSVYITKYLGKNRTEMTRNEVGVRSTLEQLYHIGTYYTDQIKFYPRDVKPMKILDGVSEEYLEYLSADFSYFGCVLDFEESKCKDDMANEHIAQRQKEKPLSTFPKCPTCGGYYIEKIPTGSKIKSSILFGVLNNDTKNTFHCKLCGYKW